MYEPFFIVRLFKILEQPPPQDKSDNIFDNLPLLSAPKKAELEDELTRYLSTPTVATKDPMLWWVEQKHMFPCLSRMALSYLSIPGKWSFKFYISFNHSTIILATSVDVERVFSKGRLILSYVRNRLSVDSTRAILCLGAWSKLDLISKDDIIHAANLPDVKKEDEELDDAFDNIL